MVAYTDWAEQLESPEIEEGRRALFKYLIFGKETFSEALAVASLRAPTVYESLIRQPLRIKPLTADLWECMVEFLTEEEDDSDPEETEGVKIQLSTGGGTKHITHSLGTPRIYPVGLTEEDLGAINVKDGVVEGIDVPASQLEFSVTKNIATSSITFAFVKTFLDNSYTTNSDGWNGFAPGEVLFKNIDCNSDTGKPVTPVTFHFAADRNLYNINFGDVEVELKKGWEYLEMKFEQVTSSSLNDHIAKIRYAVVHQIFDEVEFSSLLGF